MAHGKDSSMMRRHARIGLLWCAFLGAGFLFCQAATSPGTIIESPDHPATWYLGGFDKVDQTLVWNDRQKTLGLEITYSINGEVPLYEETSRYHTFFIRFPTVRLDEATQELYALDQKGHKIALGRVQSDFFGKKVVLSPNVELNAHRQDRALNAVLMVNHSHAGEK